MLERIIFNLFAFVLFIHIFFRMIQKNDTSYLYILFMQALGITIAFISLIAKITLPPFLLILTYILSVIFPILLIFIERKFASLTELIYITIFKIYSKTHNEDKAKEILFKLVEKNPKSYFAHKYLGEIYEKNNRLDVATEEYYRALDIRPEKNNLKYKIAELYNKCERQDDAVEILQDLLKNNPQWKEVTFLLGDILQEQERFKEAVSVYTEALKYHPDNYDLYYNLGMTYTRLNDFKSAKEYYEKAAELNSMLYIAKYNLGQISLLYNEIDDAEQYFIECLQNKPLEEQSFLCLAYIAMLKGEKEKAIEYLNAAIEDNSEIYYKIEKEIIFKVIFNKIEKPKNNSQKKNKNSISITSKERKTIEHLKNTYELVRNLNNNDIKAVKNMETQNKEEEQERE